MIAISDVNQTKVVQKGSTNNVANEGVVKVQNTKWSGCPVVMRCQMNVIANGIMSNIVMMKTFLHSSIQFSSGRFECLEWLERKWVKTKEFKPLSIGFHVMIELTWVTEKGEEWRGFEGRESILCVSLVWSWVFRSVLHSSLSTFSLSSICTTQVRFQSGESGPWIMFPSPLFFISYKKYLSGSSVRVIPVISVTRLTCQI